MQTLLDVVDRWILAYRIRKNLKELKRGTKSLRLMIDRGLT